MPKAFNILGIDRSDYMVRDFARAAAFYRDVSGLEFANGGPEDTGGEVDLADGSTFGLWHGGGEIPFQPGNSVLFAVDDLDRAIAFVESHGVTILLRHEKPVCNFATMHDSEGNTITLPIFLRFRESFSQNGSHSLPNPIRCASTLRS